MTCWFPIRYEKEIIKIIGERNKVPLGNYCIWTYNNIYVHNIIIIMTIIVVAIINSLTLET